MEVSNRESNEIILSYSVMPFAESFTLFIFRGRLFDVIPVPSQSKLVAFWVYQHVEQLWNIFQQLRVNGLSQTYPSAVQIRRKLEALARRQSPRRSHTT